MRVGFGRRTARRAFAVREDPSIVMGAGVFRAVLNRILRAPTVPGGAGCTSVLLSAIIRRGTR